MTGPVSPNQVRAQHGLARVARGELQVRVRAPGGRWRWVPLARITRRKVRAWRRRVAAKAAIPAAGAGTIPAMPALLDTDDVQALAGVQLTPTEPLTHHELANGYTVTLLHTPFDRWEAWAWRTTDPEVRLTAGPVVLATEDEARAYVEHVRALPAP